MLYAVKICSKPSRKQSRIFSRCSISTFFDFILRPIPRSQHSITFPLVRRCPITGKSMREEAPNPCPIKKFSLFYKLYCLQGKNTVCNYSSSPIDIFLTWYSIPNSKKTSSSRAAIIFCYFNCFSVNLTSRMRSQFLIAVDSELLWY